MRVIALVAGSEATRKQIELQLAEFLEGESGIEVRGASLERGALPAVGRVLGGEEEGLVLLTSSLVRDELDAAGLIGAAVRPIVAGRTVNPERLDLVVELPPGTRALFVNDEEATARECVEALAALGLDYVDFVPWHPGLPAPSERFEVAVTPGEAALVPPGCGRVIDLGARVLDFPTLAELLDRLGLLRRGAARFSRGYLTKIIQVAQRLARSIDEERRLNDRLKGVLDCLSKGVLVYESSGRVSACSDSLMALLGASRTDGRGLTLQRLARGKALLDFLTGPGPDETGEFRISGRDIAVRRFETPEGRVATFRAEGDAEAPESRLGLEYRRRGYVAKYEMDDIVGESASIGRARRIAARLAATDLSILIHGESGTGKELFASAIHAASSRRSGPFLAVDLGALSDDLIESELFGYEDGAFTGARKGGKPGLFELADGGTIFLDEIGHVSAKVQNRLLRVLQEKEVMRVGGSEIKRIDVRVIAASNEDLFEVSRRGTFRQDLYFRLKTGTLRIPPLRERREDIPLIAKAFVEAECPLGIDIESELLRAFERYDWPGNVRELRNLIAYMLAVREGPSIGTRELPDESFFEQSDAAEVARRGSRPEESGAEAAAGLDEADDFVLASLDRLEREGRRGGRDSLARLAAERGLDLSPAMARARLEDLAARGLVISSRGRRGTRLSPEGRRLVSSPTNGLIG
jgi:sigma-54 dependent transcriptional regulator, acetoin dehydrogenase operon transcriptional activator AcoR